MFYFEGFMVLRGSGIWTKLVLNWLSEMIDRWRRKRACNLKLLDCFKLLDWTSRGRTAWVSVSTLDFQLYGLCEDFFYMLPGSSWRHFDVMCPTVAFQRGNPEDSANSAQRSEPSGQPAEFLPARRACYGFTVTGEPRTGPHHGLNWELFYKVPHVH